MPLSSLDDAGVTDKHYPMDAALLPKGKVGSLRFRTVYRREMVLPLAEYSALKQVCGPFFLVRYSTMLCMVVLLRVYGVGTLIGQCVALTGCFLRTCFSSHISHM